MSYQPFHNKSAAQAQAFTLAKLGQALGNQAAQAIDGLWLVPASAAAGEAELPPLVELGIPSAVITWLRDLALLRQVPLAYLVPDPRLLPTESIRFFHVDRTWTDRLIDGALWAANLGTLDMTYRMRTLIALRAAIADALDDLVHWPDDVDHNYNYPWSAGDLQAPITGMLIRSELVRRWPDLEVLGYRVNVFTGANGRPARSDRVRLLRRDILAKDLMIVLFAGTPVRVEVKEPPTAIRFGVEPNQAKTGYEVNLRAVDGKRIGSTTVPITPRWGSSTPRIIQPQQIADQISTLWGNHQPRRPKAGSRDVALNLEQLPYVQVFSGGDEDKGSQIRPKALRPFAKATRGPAILRSGATLSKLVEDKS